MHCSSFTFLQPKGRAPLPYRLDRVRGSHHIFEQPRAPRPLNFQVDRSQAKPYQIRQFLRDVEEFQLSLND